MHQEQLHGAGVPFPDHIVLACGSGGTAAGVALAVRLTGRPTVVTAIGVCDSPRCAIVRVCLALLCHIHPHYTRSTLAMSITWYSTWAERAFQFAYACWSTFSAVLPTLS